MIDYAKEELKRIGMVDSGEPYNDWATKAILDLIELFASQSHSGFSAPYVAKTFSRLAMFKPLSPLTGEDDEWNDIGHGRFQNKRYSSVFKDEDGVAYNSEGKIFTDDGMVWYTCKDSRVNITFPYVVPDKPERVYRNTNEDSTQYQRDLIRMWDSMREDCKGTEYCAYVSCSDCPLYDEVCYDGNEISGLTSMFDAEKAVKIVTQWAKEHPIETKEVDQNGR